MDQLVDSELVMDILCGPFLSSQKVAFDTIWGQCPIQMISNVDSKRPL